MQIQSFTIDLQQPITILWMQVDNYDSTSAAAELTSLEVTKLNSFKFFSRRLQFVAVRALLNHHFNEKVHVMYLPTGAPYLDEQHLHISVSHSSDVVAVAISAQPLGIDVECNIEKPLRILSKFANDNECNCFTGIEGLQAAKLWSVKEAVFKVFRENLPFKDIQVSGKESKLDVIADHEGVVKPVQVYHGRIEDCVLSVAQ